MSKCDKGTLKQVVLYLVSQFSWKVEEAEVREAMDPRFTAGPSGILADHVDRALTFVRNWSHGKLSSNRKRSLSEEKTQGNKLCKDRTFWDANVNRKEKEKRWKSLINGVSQANRCPAPPS